MTEQECIRCHRVLPMNCFHERYDLKTKPAYKTFCKDCCASAQKKAYAENKDHLNKLVRDRYHTYTRFQRYGISMETYEAALKAQGGKCALCGVDEPGGKGTWHIDHVHTGKYSTATNRQGDAEDFRGLLCHRCNVSLGHYEKLIETVGEAAVIEYLAKGTLA